MSRERLLIIVGLLVVFSPFIGLPLAILVWVLPILGGIVTLIGISYVVRKRNQQAVRVVSSQEVIAQP
ncbi:MAG: hypothetical protein AB203_04445 [Parcubacteria bacterium C7867-008]|nr:MAG: hypothetical protein AB203_04445 [Parcubacteria bacterium C7867-008]